MAVVILVGPTVESREWNGSKSLGKGNMELRLFLFGWHAACHAPVYPLQTPLAMSCQIQQWWCAVLPARRAQTQQKGPDAFTLFLTIHFANLES